MMERFLSMVVSLAAPRRAKMLLALVASAALLALGATQMHAQGSRKDDLVINARGLPMAGATVRVCTANATGQPCSPLALIYSDAALTQALVNPTATDGLGNYSFYAAPGRYLIEISGPGITTKQIPNVILPNDPSAPTFTSLTTTSGISAFTLTLSGNLTVGGNASVTGNLAVTNQGAAPGTPAAGTVSLYTKSADKRLYYKDDTGAETGPILPGASTSADNIFTNSNRFKGPIPWRDVTAYGANSSTQGAITGSISSGTATLTLASAGDFKNGQGLVVIGAGPNSSLATPAATTATLASSPTGAVRSSNTVTLTTTAAHGLAVGTTIQVSGVTDTSFNGMFTIFTVPTGTTLTYVQAGSNATSGSGSITTNAGAFHYTGTTAPGSTTYNYKVAAVDINYGMSAAGSAITISTSVASLNKNNYNFITWKPVANAVAYVIYSDKGLGGALSPVGTAYTNAYADYGFTNFPVPEFAPATPPALVQPQSLFTTITAGGGTTTLTLAANAGTTVASKNVYHDESSFFQAALADAISDATGFGSYLKGGGDLYFPPGNYYISRLQFSSPARIRIRLAGSLTLIALPIILNQGYYSIEGGPGGSGGAAAVAGETQPTIPINVPSTVAAGLVLQNNQGVHHISGISMSGLVGHGIEIGGNNTAPSNIFLERLNLSQNTAAGAGADLLVHDNTIQLFVDHFAFTGRQDATGLSNVYFNGVNQGQFSSVDLYIGNGESVYHSIKMDQPIGNQGQGGATQHIRVSNWLNESNYDPGFFNFDGGHGNTDGLGVTDLSFERIDDSDVMVPSSHSFFYQHTNNGATISNVTLLHANYATVSNSAVLPAPILSGLVQFGVSATNTGASSGLPQASGYHRFGNFSTELMGGPVYVGGALNGGALAQLAVVVPPPQLVTATPGGGGSLAAGTYYYVVSATDVASGETKPSGELSATVGASGSVTLTYGLPGSQSGAAQNYKIYRSTTSQSYTNATFYTTTNTGTFTDTGAAGSTGTPPTLNTAYGSALAADNTFNSGKSWLLGGLNGNTVAKLGIGGLPTEKLHVVGASNNFLVDGNAYFKGGDPHIDVRAYGADNTGATDTVTAWTNALAALGTTAGTLYCPPGTYAIKSGTGLTLSVSHVRIILDPKCIIQAQTGFSSGGTMFKTAASVTDVYVGSGQGDGVGGGTWDGNSIAGAAIGLDNTSTRITVDHNEFKNFTLNIVTTTSTNNPLLSPASQYSVTHNYAHNSTGALTFFESNAILKVNDNRIDSVGSGSGKPAIDCVSCSYYEALRNIVTNSGNNEGCLYSFGVDVVNHNDNYFSGCPTAIHDDTVGRGVIARNTSVNNTITSPDFWCEACSNVLMDANTSINAAGTSLTHGSGSGSIGPAGYRTQLQSFDSTTGFTAGTNVTLSTDAGDKQEGTGSMVATANASFTTGNLFYFNFGSVTSVVWGYFDLWIKPTSGAMAYGQLQLVMSQSSACATSDLVINVPSIPSGNWYHLTKYGDGWNASQGPSGYNSFCVKVITSTPSIVVKFDSLQNAAEMLGNSIANTKSFNAKSCAIQWTVQQGIVVRDNFVQDGGFGSCNGAGMAYFGRNSANTIFTGNRSYFSTGAASSVHLQMDANTSAANALVTNDQTNATTPWSVVSGGVILADPQVKRGAVGCTTAASVGATCTSGAQSFALAYPDTNYTIACTLDTPTGVPTVSSITRSAGSFTITIAALTATGATGNYECTAKHDAITTLGP